MRLYHRGGFNEFTPEEFFNYVISDSLKTERGRIQSLRILERKFLSNKGHALDGWVRCEDGYSLLGLNIGGFPIGTGFRNYIPFLQEMDCKKVGHLYVVNSLIGVSIPYVLCGDTLRGYLTPKGFSELTQILRNQETHLI